MHLSKKRYWFFLLSFIVIIPGLISLFIWHLNLGIDFTSGSTINIRFSDFKPGVTTAQIQQAFENAKARDLSVITSTESDSSHKPNDYVWIRFNTEIDNNVKTQVENNLQKIGSFGKELSFDQSVPWNGQNVSILVVQFNGTVPSVDSIKQALNNLPNTGPIAASPTPAPTAEAGTATPSTTPTATATPAPAATKLVSVDDVQQGNSDTIAVIQTQTSFSVPQRHAIEHTFEVQNNVYIWEESDDEVGPAIASETTLYAALAVLAASCAILLFIWYAFRKVNKPWRYGACAVIALLHDVLVVLGIFSILGHFFDMQVDALFVTAMLTIIGFSVHDTIVVFDRIRENMLHRSTEPFEQVVDASLVQTMARSLNTSLTVLLTLSALTLFGGLSIRTFTLTLLIGITSGTFSSIFNASMLLVVWENGEFGQMWNAIKRFFGIKPAGKTPAKKSRELVKA